MQTLITEYGSHYASVVIGTPWLPDEINDGKLEYFSFLMAGILLANLMAFLLISRRYQYNCLGVPPIMPGTPATPYDASGEIRRGLLPSLTSASQLGVR